MLLRLPNFQQLKTEFVSLMGISPTHSLFVCVDEAIALLGFILQPHKTGMNFVFLANFPFSSVLVLALLCHTLRCSELTPGGVQGTV